MNVATRNVDRRGMVLTPEADRDAGDFIREAPSCSCHISAPCYACTHPGNPDNQIDDDSCWEPEHALCGCGKPMSLFGGSPDPDADSAHFFCACGKKIYVDDIEDEAHETGVSFSDVLRKKAAGLSCIG